MNQAKYDSGNRYVKAPERSGKAIIMAGKPPGLATHSARFRGGPADAFSVSAFRDVDMVVDGSVALDNYELTSQ